MLLIPLDSPGSSMMERDLPLVRAAQPYDHHKAASWQVSNPLRPLRRVLHALTPTLVRRNDSESPKISPTSWMDGLRGICALIVINYHFLFTFSPMATLGYHTPGLEQASNHIAALPPFCLLWDGASCVNVFFTIAGYVCSLKALQLMQEGQAANSSLLKSLSSSMFRRGFRLFLPVLAINLMSTILAYLNGFALTGYMFDDYKKWFGGVSSEINVPRKSSLGKQVCFWASEMSSLVNITNFQPVYPQHDPHLWTIACEYRTSLLLYGSLLAFAALKPRVRFMGLCALAIIFASWHRWEGPLFFVGAAAAQWDVISVDQSPTIISMHQEKTPGFTDSDASKPTRTWTSRISRTSFHRILGYCFAIYMIGYPVSGYKHPSMGYGWVNSLIPSWYAHRENKFPKSMGVLLLLYLLNSNAKKRDQGLWSSALESRTALYLGKISFALYLVHATILHSVGYAIPHMVWTRIGGSEHVWQWSLGMVIGWAFSIVMCIWTADIFQREIEVRCITLTRWIEGKCNIER